MVDEVLDDEEEEMEEAPRRRAGPPRFGSFVTIAAAILMLFGAASRVGKLDETFAFFGIDRMAEQRIRHEEERLRTALTIGAMPVRKDDLRPRGGSVPVRSDIQPPYRGEIDPDEVRSRPGRSQLSLGIPSRHGEESEEYYGDNGGDGPDDGAAAPAAQPAPPQQAEFYVVAQGDTWNRIAKEQLGDGKRWMEIRDANPAARNGLTVGMRLKLPR